LTFDDGPDMADTVGPITSVNCCVATGRFATCPDSPADFAIPIRENPHADTGPYRDAYLRHLYSRAEYYDGLSHEVLGRSVAHVLLLHHNLINALFLRDVIHMFQDKGWTLIDAETAFKDPVYSLHPDILPAGESVLWALAKQHGVSGLRYPAEDDVYEKPILDRLGL